MPNSRDSCERRQKTSGNGYYFRTVSHPRLADLRESFYSQNRKVVPYELLESNLSELGLAVWIMDDGAADGNQLRINTQSFSAVEAGRLASLIRAKFGIVMSINLDKGCPRLRRKASSMGRLVEIVKTHTPPSMLYKLSL
jgi:hypothetical protein